MVVAPAPMGLGYLSSALKTRRGDTTRIVDGRRYRLSGAALLAEAERFQPEAIGITAMSFEAPEATDLIRRLKQRWPEVPVILGGPHATGCGPALLEACAADYLVLGEGEDALVELLDALEGKGELGGVRGVARREQGKVVDAGPRSGCVELSELEVDWEGINPPAYFSWWRRNAMNTIARSKRRLPVFTSRGCPFGCAYCHHIFGRTYRTFPVEKTVAEMLRLRDRYRLGEFEIIDDTFNLKLEHSKAVMREIIRRGVATPLAFSNGLRADRMDDELLDLMRRAPTFRVDYAIESASPRIQKMMHKNLNLERAREVVKQTAATGIVTGAYYILGFPGESEDEMMATLEYAGSLPNHIASFFYLMPFPGTEVAEAAAGRREELRGLTFRDASDIVINLSAVPDPVLRRLKQTGYRRFYFSLRRMARIARDVPKNPPLLIAALAALRLSFQEAVNY